MANIQQNHISHLTLKESAEVYSVAIMGFFARATALINTWEARINARKELSSMDARILRDIGITQEDALREAKKPFWRG